MRRLFDNENLSSRKKHELIAKYIRTPKGRMVLAKYLQSPVKRQLLYEGVLRKAFYVEELLPGASPYYDKDVNVPAYVVSEEADSVMAIQRSTRIDVPMFEIAANPMIPFTTIQEKRFDIVERTLEQGKSAIMEEEDTRGFNLIAATATQNTTNAVNPTIGVGTGVTPALLADAFGQVEKWRLRVSRVFLNPLNYADIRKFDRDILDIESQAFLLKTGIQNSLWGAHLIQSSVVPVDTVYVVAEPEYFGRMPIRTDLTILSADDNRQRMIGFSMFEIIGIAVTNPLGLQALSINE